MHIKIKYFEQQCRDNYETLGKAIESEHIVNDKDVAVELKKRKDGTDII